MTSKTHPLQFRDYRLIWLTRFISTAATSAMVVVMGAQVYQVARQAYGMSEAQAAFLLGVLGLVQFIPFLLLTPVAGVLADRMDRRYLGAIATSVDLIIGLVLAAANTWGFMSLPLLFTMAACYGAARVFIGPAISAITPNVVPSELLPKAIATSSIAWQSAAVLGPAVGGFLLAADPSLPYWYASGMLSLGIFTLLAIRHRAPGTTIEILTPDFLKCAPSALEKVVEARPDVFNHNLETVPGLYPEVRPGARYFHSLRLLQKVKELDPGMFTKSGIMVGLGEDRQSVQQVMDDMRAADVDFLTIGQYLQPTPKHHRIDRFVTPEEFKSYETAAYGKGFLMVSATPLTRSSYHAGDDFARMRAARLEKLGRG